MISKRNLHHVYFFVIIALFPACNHSTSDKTKVDSKLPIINGDGNVIRTVLTSSFLTRGEKDTIVDFKAYAVPSEAAFPSNSFMGKLKLHHLNSAGEFKEITDYLDSTDSPIKHLPEFDFEFVQTGSHLIPVRRGYIESRHPYWEYILEPGRVWNEKGDKGYSRASVPFALKQKNANCLHNGVLTFLFKNNGAITSAVYQIASETCTYFKFDMWGTVDTSYEPYFIPDSKKYIADYVKEVTGRIPTKPIADLEIDFPGSDSEQFSAPLEVSSEHMTLYGFLIDGINYVGGCNTRWGIYPYCEVLDIPSYSTAKSLAAGMGLMRLEKLFPGSSKQPIGKLIPEYAESENWSDVTIENAIDMATGNYKDAKSMVDEDAPTMQKFFTPEDHYSKVTYSLKNYTRQSDPGTFWVYHTTDTYVAGTAMNRLLKELTKDSSADYFRDLVVEDIFKPIGTSPTSWISQRTYDSSAQVFSGYGLFFQRDDIAKLGNFLVNGAIINNQQMLDSAMYSSVINATKGTSLPTPYKLFRYNNGFWLLDLTETDICSPNFIPFMSGYGGIRIFLLPNNSVYYYVSDNFEYTWEEGLREANKLRPFCELKK